MARYQYEVRFLYEVETDFIDGFADLLEPPISSGLFDLNEEDSAEVTYVESLDFFKELSDDEVPNWKDEEGEPSASVL